MIDTNQDNILLCTFPQEILLIIFTFVGLSNWNSLVLVCRDFRDLLYPQPLWNSFFTTGFLKLINGQQYTIHFPSISRNVVEATFSLLFYPKLRYDFESWIKDRLNLKTLKIEYENLTSAQYNDCDLKTNIESIFNCPKITSLTIHLPQAIEGQIYFAIIFKIIEENIILQNLNFTFYITHWNDDENNQLMAYDQDLEIRKAIISFLTNCCQRYDHISINIKMDRNLYETWEKVFKQTLPFLKYSDTNLGWCFVSFGIEFSKK